jgi:hypothetical protein
MLQQRKTGKFLYALLFIQMASYQEKSTDTPFHQSQFRNSFEDLFPGNMVCVFQFQEEVLETGQFGKLRFIKLDFHVVSFACNEYNGQKSSFVKEIIPYLLHIGNLSGSSQRYTGKPGAQADFSDRSKNYWGVRYHESVI